MGQEESTPMVEDNVPPRRLESRSLAALASYIKSGKATKIVTMTGAGISTSAGIPDFRSPETGLYANLARLNLPYPEAVFDISFFRNNPEPFYALAHELYPGRFRPTITHCFIALLHDKGLLLRAFTQNIDCLEREAGVAGSLVVEAHGSFATQRCIECKVEFSDTLMAQNIQTKEVPRCLICHGLVKPDIVFFGEALPPQFFANRERVSEADLVIVMGTSLQVQPFASLPGFALEAVPRLLINMEQVGNLGCRADDVVVLGDCDDGVRKLARELGWLEELEEKWAHTTPDSIAAERIEHVKVAKTKDEFLSEEVEKLTRDIDEVLMLSENYKRTAYAEDRTKDCTKYTRLDSTDDVKHERRYSSAAAAISTTRRHVAGANSSEKTLLAHVFPHFAGKPAQ